jgi:uncharacterized protein YdaU (DUF1376 family)
MSKDPAFLFYSKDWLEGTAELMPDEKGVYIDLLCHQHQKGSLPKDTERLARIVGLNPETFLKIWDVIKIHFNQVDDRLVNQRLNRITRERSERSRVNTVNGTFAGILRLGQYDKKQWKELKSRFIAKDFLNYEKSELSNRITDWIVGRLKSIENENIVLSLDFSFIKENNWKILFFEWLEYKKAKKQSYKTQDSIEECFNNLVEISDNNLDVARKIINQSKANNYAGLFPLKNSRRPEVNPEEIKIIQRTLQPGQR